MAASSTRSSTPAYRSMKSGRWETGRRRRRVGDRVTMSRDDAGHCPGWPRRARSSSASPPPRPRPSRPPANGAPRRSPRTGSSTSSAPATRGSPSRRCSRATARTPGFNPIVELSMTFHTQVVGANGQRQAMFIERMPGLAEVILVQLHVRPARRHDRVLGRRHDRRAGRDGARRAAARPAGDRRDVVAQSMSDEPIRPSAAASSTRRTSSIDLCTPPCRCADHDRRARDPGRPGLDDRRRRHRQFHQGADGRAPRRARRHAARHHPGLGRRRRALAGPVRRGLSRACAADRPCHRRGPSDG